MDTRARYASFEENRSQNFQEILLDLNTVAAVKKVRPFDN